MKRILIVATAVLLFTGSLVMGATISLSNIGQWNYCDFSGSPVYFTNPVAGFFESTTNGIRVKAYYPSGVGALSSKSAHFLAGSVVTYTWSGTGGSSYMQHGFGLITGVWFTDAGNLWVNCINASYGNSYAGSWVAIPNRTYQTVVTFSDTSYNSITTDVQTGTVQGSQSGSFDFTRPLRLCLMANN